MAEVSAKKEVKGNQERKALLKQAGEEFAEAGSGESCQPLRSIDHMSEDIVHDGC